MAKRKEVINGLHNIFTTYTFDEYADGREKDMYEISRFSYEQSVDENTILFVIADSEDVGRYITINGVPKIISENDNFIITDGVVFSGNGGGTGSGTGVEYTGGTNIDITNNVISAKGYVFNEETKAYSEGEHSHAEGRGSHAEGYYTKTNNDGEHAEGRYNISHENTISSIGIGSAENSRCNALEVMKNGDLYIKGIGDYVGGTNGDPHTLESVFSLQTVISNIQEGVKDVVENPINQIQYVPGNNISINNGVISALGYSYSNRTMEIGNADIQGTLSVNDNFTSLGFSTFKNNIVICKPNTTETTVSINASTGTISAKGGFYETSDIRKKNVIDELPLDKAYELISNCQSIIYTLKDNTDKQQIGLIAQEVQQYFPEVVSEDKDGYLSLDYAKLTSVIFRVLKDVIDRLSKLENK